VVAGADVRVRRLALRAPARDPVPGMVIDLEDAFRTASFPGARPGVILLVRRLDLGPLRPGTPRTRLALHIAERLARLRPLRLRLGAGEHLDAQSVTAPGAIEASAVGIVRWLAGPLQAWYWLRLVPELATRPSAGALASLLTRLEVEHGSAAVGRLLVRLAEAGLLASVLVHLDRVPGKPRIRGKPVRSLLPDEAAAAIDVPSDRMPILVRSLATATWSDIVLPVQAILPTALADTLLQQVRAWGPEDARGPWLVRTLIAAVAGPAAVTETVRDLAAALSGPVSRAGRSETPLPPVLLAGRRRGDAAADRVAPRSVDRPPETVPFGNSSLTAVPRLEIEPAAETAVVSPYGGLLFLINVISRLDLIRADAALGLALCPRLLVGFAERAGLGEADPLRAVLPNLRGLPALSAVAGHVPPPPFVLPDLAWRLTASPAVPIRLRRVYGLPGRRLAVRGGGRAILGLIDPGGVPAVRSWIIAGTVAGGIEAGGLPHRLLRSHAVLVQRLVHRALGRGWRYLVRRPAEVVVTATHVDLILDGLGVEVAVRRAGLDLDPGWVPWLGRVVSIHYDHSGRDDLRRACRGGAP